MDNRKEAIQRIRPKSARARKTKTSVPFWVFFVFLSVSALYAQGPSLYRPELHKPGLPAPKHLFLRPLIPLPELMDLAGENEAFAQARILEQERAAFRLWCASKQDRRRVFRRAWLSEIASYERQWGLTLPRFFARIRLFLKKGIPEYRKKRLTEALPLIEQLQKKRHAAILTHLRGFVQGLPSGDCSPKDQPDRKPPRLFYKELYLARYEFWKRLELAERLRLHQVLAGQAR